LKRKVKRGTQARVQFNIEACLKNSKQMIRFKEERKRGYEKIYR
jgi:hypothetical protein